MSVRFDAETDSYSRTTGLGSLANFTDCGWIRIATDRDTYSCAWSFGASGQDLITDADGTTMRIWDGPTGNFIVTGFSMTVGTWYWVAISVAGTSGTIYWRSATQNTLNSESFTLGTANRDHGPLKLGWDGVSGEWWNGNLAAFKAYDTNLSASEALQESFTYRPNRAANLKIWYPFDKAETTDYSGNGQTLTAGSTATTTEGGPPIPWRVTSPRVILPVAGGTTFTQTLAGSTTPTGSLAKQDQKPTSGATTPSGAIAKQAQKTTAGSTTPTGALAKAISNLLSGSTTPTGALAKLISKALAGSTTPSGALANAVVKILALAGSTTPTGSLAKQVDKQITGSTTPTSTVAKAVSKVTTGTTTPAGALLKLIGRVLSGSTTPSGALTNTIVGATAKATSTPSVTATYTSTPTTTAPNTSTAAVAQAASSTSTVT